MSSRDLLRRRFRRLLRDGLVLWRVLRDPRTPRHVKVAAGLVLLYAVSPLDLVPDPILLGLIDDLVLVPLGLAGVRRLAPPGVVGDAEASVGDDEEVGERLRRVLWVVAIAWVASLVLFAYLLWWWLA